MTRKPRVLFVGAFTTPAGTQIRGGQLAACRAIIDSPLSQQVDWILLNSTMESIPPPAMQRRAWLAIQRVIRFTYHLIASSPDVALIFSAGELSIVEKGLMAILAHVAGKRVVLCPRSGFITREYRASRFMRWWLPLVLRSSDCVVCQGQRWREFFSAIAGLPFNRLPIIYNLIDVSEFDDIPLPTREVAERVLLMGWVEKNKGIFDLIEVVSRLRTELQGMRFIICGHGQDWDRVNAEIKTRGLEGSFELRGWVDNAGKRQALHEADFGLMLSHHEGMPNALIESMAAGRPVVATSVGAVPDVVEEGRNGFLCEVADVDEIGFRILELRQSAGLRRRMGEEARRSIAQKMDVSVGWQHWREVLCPNPKRTCVE